MALTLMCKHNKQLHAKGFLFTRNIEDCYNKLVDIMILHRAKMVYLEDNSDKGLAATQFRKGDKESGRPPFPAVDYHESENKHIKILAYLYKPWKNIYWARDTDPEYLNQIIDYEEGEEPDDCPDSAATLCRIMGEGTEDILSYYKQ